MQLQKFDPHKAHKAVDQATIELGPTMERMLALRALEILRS